MNICLCGAQSGRYPHSQDCPFPYYGNMPSMVAQWKAARDYNRNSMVAKETEMVYPQGTVVHCNRCDKPFPLSRDREGYEFSGNEAATRLTQFERCPHCETRDTHWVYRRDFESQNAKA